MAAEYEVNIKINSRQIERELKNIDKIVSNIGKPKGGGSRRKPGIAGLLPSSADLKAAENGITRLTAKTKTIQNIQDKFSERKTRASTRSNALNEKELRLNKQLTAEARARLRLLSQAGAKGFDGTRPQGRQLANDINARVKAQDKRARLLNKINEMEAKGLNVGKLRKQLSKATTDQAARRFASADKEFNILRKTIELEQAKLRILKEQRRNFPSSPIRGTSAMMGSPAQIAASGRQIASPIRGGLGFPGSRGFLAGATASRTPFGPSFPTGGAASPVRGGFNFPGSPGFLAGATASRTPFGPNFPTGGAASPVRGGFNFPGSPGFLAGATASRTPFGPAGNFPTSLGAGGARLPVRGSTSIPGSPKAIQAAKTTELKAQQIQRSWGKALGQLQETANSFKFKNVKVKQSWAKALGQLKETSVAIKGKNGKVKQSWIKALNELDETAKDISKNRKKTAKRGRNKKLEGVALGAGFPLLFGGGAGSVLGGAAGGLTGSFGAQIAFSAIGQQIDKFVASTLETGKALTSTGGALDFMREKSLFSEEATERLAAELEGLGKIEQLSELLAAELVQKIGNDGVTALQDLGKESDETNRLFNELTLQLQALIAGPLKDFLEIVNSTLGAVTASSKFKMLESELTGQDRKDFDAEVTRRKALNLAAIAPGSAGASASSMRSSMGTEGVGSLSVKDFQEINKMFLPKLQVTAKISDLSGVKPPKKDTAGEKAANRLKASQERIRFLEIETTKIKNITQFKDRIAQAELDGDKQLVVRIGLEERIAEINARKDVAMEKLTGRDLPLEQKLREQIAITSAAEAREAEAKAEAARSYAKIIQDEQNKALKDQADILKKNFALQEEELKKAQALAKGLTDIVRDGFVDGIKAATDETRSLSDALANMMDRLADKFLNLAANLAFYGNPQGDLKQGAGLVGSLLGSVASIFNPFASLMSPGGRYEGQSGKLGPIPALPPLPGKALGGSVSSGRPYLVGERGPEMFVPGAQGNIVPNNAMGGGANVTVNVDASGSSVEGDGDQAAQLGKAIGIAVQQELIKQKRPGGLLTR